MSLGLLVAPETRPPPSGDRPSLDSESVHSLTVPDPPPTTPHVEPARTLPRSSSRLSGFFTNLIHRRDHSVPPPTIQEGPPVPAADTPFPSPSPPPPERSLTPPPQLPPPTLQELGLSLSIITSHLCPAHFSSPPTSGAFLAPHYLLLCHSQGLDVLPLVSPPAPQPYALVRRVCFKNIVVMEQRGVLVAIAGRRDGVRVYALEEVKKAIEWRIDMEVRRERDRTRRDTIKKLVMNGLDVATDPRQSSDSRKASLSTPPPAHPPPRALLRKASYGSPPIPSLPPTTQPQTPLIPRSPTARPPKKSKSSPPSIPPPISEPSERPPPYTSPTTTAAVPLAESQPSTVTVNPSPGSNLLGPPPPRNGPESNSDIKTNWVDSSDDEAIDIVAAGSSGSQALDERTSAIFSPTPNPVHGAQPILAPSQPTIVCTSTNPARRHRPSNLDLSLSLPTNPVAASEPPPTPTLLTLRQALSHSPVRNLRTGELPPDPDTPFGPADDDDDDGDNGISLAQALLESRIPNLPPMGTRRAQEPILLQSSPDADQCHLRTSENSIGNLEQSQRRRRRWSVLLGGPPPEPVVPVPTTASADLSPPPFARSRSFRSLQSHHHIFANRPSSSPQDPANSATTLPDPSEATTQSSRSSRFIPRMISNALSSRRSDERPALPTSISPDTSDGSKRVAANPLASHAQPPKLEYVKLPGTKGALIVKAVETAKKSFLAILCGENGEKVELFAGTYRTALGLSRTFILPDSPRSLELQLQGDDLVEVFLVFSQNVFGLEPATVRVREVRIGRAERRAARRRAREVRAGDLPNDSEVALGEDVNVSIGVSVTVANNGGSGRPQTPPLVPTEHPNAQQETVNTSVAPTFTHSEDLLQVATANNGPYTTFQQLGFAPKFPLASIADEYIIPPTYATFLEYRAEFEPEEGASDLTQVQFSPPGLPIPVPAAPSRWYYRDPRGIIHGPWKATLMQAWYRDGLLPPDLPLRREEDDDYMLLKDLRLQSVDPTHPFRAPPLTHMPNSSMATTLIQDSEKPLLPPLSLLCQPRHFGPPPLFFSSRGGHSTAIVDARGRSVLKGRFVWSSDEHDVGSRPPSTGRMGDIKRLEALDVQDRAVLVAMRRGGLEAMDLSDALLKPADESRTVLPQFAPPLSNINRRAPFVWKTGTPVSGSSGSFLVRPSSSGRGRPGSAVKKLGDGSAKNPASRTDFSSVDNDPDSQDEILFLGRKEDEIYICERNAGSFRILKLSPLHIIVDSPGL